MLILYLCLTPLPATGQEADSYRQPVALTLDESGKKLVTANAKSGTLSIVNLHTKQDRQQNKQRLSHSVTEKKLGQSLRDVIRLKENRFLVVDFLGHQLIEIQLSASGAITVLHKVPVAKYPHCVITNRDQTKVFVSSLWSRRVTCLERPNPKQPFKPTATIDFEFAPREMVYLEPDHKLVVAGNFQGKLAVVDCRTNTVEFIHQTTGHNIRGLGLANDGNTIVMSNQMLNELAHTNRNDIHWGLLMSNDLRWFKKEAFLQQDSELYKSSHMHPLGKENNAAGDPGRLAFSKEGTVVVTIGGTNEVAFGREDYFWLKRVKTGKRPADVAIDPAGRVAYVANSFDDTISVLDLEQESVTETISLGKQRALTDIEKGEQLFFDASLSHDGWMSCHSCHTDGHTNSGLNDNFTDGSFGAPKRVLSLLGKDGTEPLAWDGKTKDFQTQISNSIASTMQSKEPPVKSQVALLETYLLSLPAPPSLATARDQIDQTAVAAGKKVFQSYGCADCHQAPLYTSPKTYDVGFQDEEGNTEFNPPSLLGLSQRAAYLHDNRASSIEDVLFKFKHQIPKTATKKDLESLSQFLKSL